MESVLVQPNRALNILSKGGRFAALVLTVIFGLCLFIFRPSSAWAGTDCREGILAPTSDAIALDVGSCVEWLFDPEQRFTASELAQGLGHRFLQSESQAPNLGLRSGKFWLKVRLRNVQMTDRDFYLSMGNPLVDRATVYQLLSGQEPKRLGEAGVLVAGRDKMVRDRDVVFVLNVPAQSSSEFLVEMSSLQHSYFPTLRTQPTFIQHQLNENLVFGFYFGVIAVMALYNFVLFFLVRDKSYLWYVGSISFFHGICFAGLMGASNHFLWPESPLWAQRQLPASSPLGLLFTFLFANSFLKLEDHSQTVRKVVRGFIATTIGLFLLSTVWYDVKVVEIGFVAQISALSIILWVAVPNALRGERSARLFLLAWSFLIIGGLAFSLGQFGVYSHNFFTQNAFLLGSAAEVVLLSFALGDKINAIRREKEIAQQRALDNANARAVIEAELQAANAVQETLFPPEREGQSVELSTCYLVAERVGGDWFWYTEDQAAGLVYFYIGDVTGHGVPSALLTGVICGAINSLDARYSGFSDTVTPADRLMQTASVVNDVVVKTGARSDRWVSMCLMCLNVRTGELLTVNAGHPFPLIWRAKTQSLESVVCSGSLMGHSTARFSVREDQLEEGDSVMLFTDGLLEAKERLKPSQHQSRRREMSNLFKNSQSPTQIVEMIRQEMALLTKNGNTLTDDVTLVVFRWLNKRENIVPLKGVKVA